VLIVCTSLSAGFLVAVYLVLSVAAGLFLSFVACVVLYCLMLGRAYVRNGGFVPLPYRRASLLLIVAVGVLAALIGVFAQFPHALFIGLSVAWACVFLLLLLGAYVYTPRYTHYTDTLFPAFAYREKNGGLCVVCVANVAVCGADVRRALQTLWSVTTCTCIVARWRRW
jgi:hypothetical protein